MDELTDGLFENSETGPEAPTRRRPPVPPARTIARLCLEEAFKAAGLRQADIGSDDLLLVQVPGPSWIGPVTGAAGRNLAFGERFRPEGKSKSDKDREAAALEAAGKGKSVLAVADFPATQAPRLLAAADHVVKVLPPGPRILRAAIRLATGKRVPKLPLGLGRGLDLPDLCAAIRPGSSPQRCIARLETARARLSPELSDGRAPPPLEELHGYGEAMDWCRALVADIGRWRNGALPFHAIDRACVWASEPGLGKTSLARSLARSAGLPLVATSVGAWFAQSPGYLDSVIKQIDAALNAPVRPALVFLDELEALPDRRTLSARGRDWWTPVITHFLTALDGAANGPASELVIVGATNHPDRLDPALVRPGRLNRIITIGPPDAAALAGILRQHLGTALPSADLARLAAIGVGATGAEAAAWVRAAQAAARAAGRPLSEADLAAAVDPQRGWTDQLLWRTAVHEASHAAVGHALGLDVDRATIVRRGDTLGSVTFRGDGRDDARAVEALVVMTLAGRAGEAALTGSVGGGGAGDLDQATRLLAAYHATLGFGRSLVSRASFQDARALLERDAGLRRTVEAHLARLHAEAERIVHANREAIRKLAKMLLRERVVERGRLHRFLSSRMKPTRPQRASGPGDVDSRA